MSFSKYQRYRPSNALWIGDIPAHWRVAALRWLARRYAGGTPDKANPAYWTDGTIPWLNSGAVNQRMITEASEYITEDAYSNSSARWVPEGALVMALAGQGKTKGMVAQLAIRATCNQSMAAIVPAAELNPRYLYWWLDAQYQNIRNLAGGDLRDGLNLDLLGQIPCPLPPSDEQSSIASFLDRETAKIDTLVAEQERLIERLEEKRQAVISHAVTKGLDPSVTMKHSNLSGVGHIPAHWTSVRLKRLASIRYGIGEPPKYRETGTPLIRATNVDRGKIVGEGLVFVDPDDLPASRIVWLRAGDVIVVRSGAYTGDSAIVLPEHVPAIAGFDMVVRPHSCQSRFLQWALLSSYLKIDQIDLEKLRAAQPHLNAEELGSCWVLVPPLDEQVAIDAFIEVESAKINDLIAEARRAIALFEERRSALIAAAVTGRIDVRQLEAA